MGGSIEESGQEAYKNLYVVYKEEEFFKRVFFLLFNPITD